jgi:RHS repeat-associated protein
MWYTPSASLRSLSGAFRLGCAADGFAWPAPVPAPLGSPLTTTHRVISYTYDSLYRLTDADYSTGEFYQYAYDPVGNHLSLTTTVGVVNYQYDAANRLTSVNGQAYTWDANGNLLSDGVRSYSYDHANRLAQVVSGTLTTGFTYNGAGDRVAKTVDGVTTAYVLDPAAGLTQVLQETTASQTTRYLYGHDGSTALTTGLLAQYDSGTWAYHVNDGLGSVRQLADTAGQVVQGYSFSPFGVPLGESGGEPYGFTGEQWDASAGLVYLRARYYQPGVGRFTQRDLWPGNIYRPRTRNGFDYASGNPVRFTDPSGFCTFGEPDYHECMQLASLLARAYDQPREGSPPGTLLLQFLDMSYEELQDQWAQLDPVHSQERYDIIEQEATRFGLPAEFIAAVIAAEVEYDTDWINTVYDAWTTCLDLGLVPAFPGNPPPWVHLELWHYYYGLG